MCATTARSRSPPRRGQRSYSESGTGARDRSRRRSAPAAMRPCSRSVTSPSCATPSRAKSCARLGHATTLSYLADVRSLVLRETGLLPHVNPGVMTREDIAMLREVSVSQGIMLESIGRAAVREGRRALRIARQGSRRAPRDVALGRRAAGSVHHRHSDRHRRDARGAHRFAARDSRSCTRSTVTSRK